MNFITRIKKASVIILVFSLILQTCCLVANATYGDMVPLDKEAIFDEFGNSAQDYDIVFSRNQTDNNGRFPTTPLTTRPDAATILKAYDKSSLNGVHPRVLATKADFAAINAKCEADESLEKIRTELITDADSYMNIEPLHFVIGDSDGDGLGWEDGDEDEKELDKRLWYVSERACGRVIPMAMAYQLTGERKYLERCYQELEAICLFPSWNPSNHHIDTGALVLALGIGYDWLYEGLTEEQRGKLERGAARLGLTDYVDGFQGRDSDMLGGCRADQNHNGVMNGGGIATAAAFMDVFPEACSYIMAECITASEYAIRTYGSKGQWYEGIGYATMQLDYWTYGVAAVEKIFGNCFGMDTMHSGVAKASDYIMQMQTPYGCFGFADGNTTSGKSFTPAQLWWLKHTGGDPATFDHSRFSPAGRNRALMLLWDEPVTENTDAGYNGDLQVFYEDEKVDVAVMRSSWGSIAPTYAGIKGGCAGDTHAHMDMSSFVFMSDGVRWCYDLGAENYNISGYWNYGTSSTKNSNPEKDNYAGQRWSYYRMRGESHNVMLVDPKPYTYKDSNGKYYGGFNPSARAKINRFEQNDGAVLATIDMTGVHASSKVESALRGYYFADTRQSFVVRDEIKFSNTAGTTDVHWYLTTEHPSVVSADGKSVTQIDSKTGTTLKMEFACDEDYEIVVEDIGDIEKAEGSATNAGMKRITVKINADLSGKNFAFTAKLTPSTVDSPESISIYDTATTNWTLGSKTPKVKGVMNAPYNRLPEGTKVELQANSFAAPSGSYVKLFKISGGNETEVALDKSSKAQIEISNTDAYVLRLYNNEGTVIATSSEVRPTGLSYTTETTIWDENFDTRTLKKSSGSRTFYEADGKTQLLNSVGNFLNANCWTTTDNENMASIIELLDDGTGNKYLLLNTLKGRDQAQINHFGMTATEGIVKASLDLKFNDFNTAKYMSIKANGPESGWIGTSGAIGVNTSGYVNFNGVSKKLSTGQWYTFTQIIDLAAGTLDFILDDQYIGTRIDNPITKTERLSVRSNTNADTELLVDNFKVYNYK